LIGLQLNRLVPVLEEPGQGNPMEGSVVQDVAPALELPSEMWRENGAKIVVVGGEY
jgi:hypothetical protein